MNDINNRKFDAIVCLSAIDWDFLWQRTQEVMSQFASLGYPVLFVENTGVRTPGVKDLPRVWARLKKIFSGDRVLKVKNQSHKNVQVLSPTALPFPYMTIAVNINTKLITKRIMRFSKTNNIPVNRILLWSYMTTPLAISLAKTIPWAGVIVDLVSDPCKVEGAEAIVQYHKQMLEHADTILCASNPMVNTAKQQIPTHHDKIHLFEDGFSTWLSQSQDQDETEVPTPELIKNRRIAAYIGGVNNKIWWDAVSVMASRFPEIDFVFVGPKDINNLSVMEGKNLIWQSPFEKYSHLGYFLKKSCVGLIPYLPESYIAEMRPAKINEYVVMGLPIVATRMPELERLGKEYGEGIVYLADTAEEFIDSLKRALDEDCEEYRNKRRQIAIGRSWEKVCKEIETALHCLT